jgi:phenylpropionate dioxygenase-like ring-hydroxylating dioxygenase large terminal subunit
LDAATIRKIRSDMDYEFGREAAPEGFPALPPIPTGRYTDADFFELEREAIWSRSWLLVGREEDFAEPGSYRTLERGGRPLLIVRGRDDRIRCFYNTCQHRGAPVVRKECGVAARLQCQYHSWSYDLDGRLLAVPDRRDFTDLDQASRSLAGVRCESYDGWLFVNLDPDAQPLEQWLGPVAREWRALHGRELRVLAERHQRVACNWKIAADAFLETYHVKTIHRSTVSQLLDHRGAAMGLFPNGHSRMVTPKWEEAVARAAGSPLEQIPGLDPLYAESNVAYSLFPNLITPLDTVGFPFITFWPVDLETTDVDWTWYAPPPASEAQQKTWQTVLAGFDVVMGEDFQNLAPMQRSVASGALASIPLSYQERRIYHLHEQIDRVIGPERIPAEMRVEPCLAPFVVG